MLHLYILIGLASVVVFWLISTYNFFVSSKTRIKASIQEIGNQLKRQVELIPNLQSSVKGYLKHEKEIFEMLSVARKAVAGAIKSSDSQKMAEAGSRLAEVIPKIAVAVESNPELKGNEVVTRLMDELRDTSDKVMYARRLLIDITLDYNVKRVSFPTNIVASIFGFRELPGLVTPESGEHLELSKDDLKSPKIKL